MNNECEAIRETEVADRWAARYAGEFLRTESGRVRIFHSERAAMAAAYFARDGKDNRPTWRKRGCRTMRL